MSLPPLPSLPAGGWLDFVGMELSVGLGFRDWGYIRVISELGLYWGHIRVILGLYWE